MGESKTYVGSCHCGKVRYEATTDLAQVLQCNCSICSRAGYLLTFVPEDQFKLLAGEDSLSDYQFHKHHIHHVFCTTCGIRSFAKGVGRGGQPMRMLNVRCLDGVDPSTLTITPFDGKNRL